MYDRGFEDTKRSAVVRLTCLCAATTLQVVAWCQVVAADPAKVLGEWLTEDKVSRIELTECDDALCGHISWIREEDATNEAGEPVTDVNNPDAAMRSRPLVGLRIFHELKPSEDNDSLWEGRVYNPENGEMYTASLLPQRDGKLRVKGCILDGWVCKSEIWTRPDAVETDTDENTR